VSGLASFTDTEAQLAGSGNAAGLLTIERGFRPWHSTPNWKCYLQGEYMAACKHAEDAAALVSVWTGGEVRWRHKNVVWREGAETFPAGESFDRAAEIMRQRIRELAQ